MRLRYCTLTAPFDLHSTHRITITIVGDCRESHVVTEIDGHVTRKDLKATDLGIPICLLFLRSRTSDAAPLDELGKSAGLIPKREADTRFSRYGNAHPWLPRCRPG